jgi:hypothetical protein
MINSKMSQIHSKNKLVFPVFKVSLRGTLQAKSGLYIYLSKKYMVKLDKTE